MLFTLSGGCCSAMEGVRKERALEGLKSRLEQQLLPWRLGNSCGTMTGGVRDRGPSEDEVRVGVCLQPSRLYG